MVDYIKLPNINEHFLYSGYFMHNTSMYSIRDCKMVRAEPDGNDDGNIIYFSTVDKILDGYRYGGWILSECILDQYYPSNREGFVHDHDVDDPRWIEWLDRLND